MEFIIDSIRILFFSIDKIVYGFIDDVYALLLQLARTSIFSQSAIHAFSERVYAFVGIFMLFKVSVSLINYVLNPDDFTDKDKGFSSIVKHVVLALVLIAIVPYIFSEAYDLQSIILEENTIMNVIFGSPADRDIALPNSSYAESAGQKIQFTVMYAFAQPNYEEFYNDNKFDLVDCQETYDTYPSGHARAGDYIFRELPIFGTNTNEGRTSNFIYQLRPSCWGTYDPATDTYTYDGEIGQLAALFDEHGYGVVYQNYAQGVAQQSFNMFFIKDIIRAKEQGVVNPRYLINYKFGISTAVGIGVIYLLLLFCIDIAVRSVKLGFLQMIAPIPILSYCDPKSGKDGMFKKWADMCVKTYLELFMRLFALFFGIYVISLIGTFRDVVTGEIVSGWDVSIFMIIGILIFIKKLPEILKEVLNIKSDGKFSFNPLKKLEDEALFGKQIAGAGKKALGAAGGVGAAALVGGAGLVTGQGLRLGAMGKAIAGGFKGEKFGKNFSNSYSAARARKKQLDEMDADGVTPGDVRRAKLYNAFHGQSTADRVKTLEEQGKAIQSYYDTIKNQAIAMDSRDVTDSSGRLIKSAKTLSKELDEIKKTSIDRGNYGNDAAGQAAYEAAIEQQRLAVKRKETELEDRIDGLASGQIRGAATSITGTSAEAVIAQAKQAMDELVKATNDLGTSLASSYVPIDTSVQDTATKVMKASKGIGAQTSVGDFVKIKDTAKYTGGSGGGKK